MTHSYLLLFLIQKFLGEEEATPTYKGRAYSRPFVPKLFTYYVTDHPLNKWSLKVEIELRFGLNQQRALTYWTNLCQQKKRETCQTAKRPPQTWMNQAENDHLQPWQPEDHQPLITLWSHGYASSAGVRFMSPWKTRTQRYDPIEHIMFK